MSQSISYLQLDSITIRQHDGLFSLNDLHRASGGEPKHEPNRFLRNDQTEQLVSEIQKAGIPAFTSKPKVGTYACRELVIAYAAWISAAFHLKVIRVFLAAGQPKQESPASLDITAAAAMKAAREAALKYFDDFRAGKPAGFDIPQEILTGLISEALQRTRLLVSFSHEGKLNLSPVDADAYVMGPKRLAKAIETSDAYLHPEDLVALHNACAKQITEGYAYMHKKLTSK